MIEGGEEFLGKCARQSLLLDEIAKASTPAINAPNSVGFRPNGSRELQGADDPS